MYGRERKAPRHYEKTKGNRSTDHTNLITQRLGVPGWIFDRDNTSYHGESFSVASAEEEEDDESSISLMLVNPWWQAFGCLFQGERRVSHLQTNNQGQYPLPIGIEWCCGVLLALRRDRIAHESEEWIILTSRDCLPI